MKWGKADLSGSPSWGLVWGLITVGRVKIPVLLLQNVSSHDIFVTVGPPNPKFETIFNPIGTIRIPRFSSITVEESRIQLQQIQQLVDRRVIISKRMNRRLEIVT